MWAKEGGNNRVGIVYRAYAHVGEHTAPIINFKFYGILEGEKYTHDIW